MSDQVNAERIIDRLKKVRECANTAIEKAALTKDLFANQAINWGDLSCTLATYSIDDEGYERYSCLIEEADIDSYELCEYVSDYLEERGFLNIDVRSEW